MHMQAEKGIKRKKEKKKEEVRGRKSERESAREGGGQSRSEGDKYAAVISVRSLGEIEIS